MPKDSDNNYLKIYNEQHVYVKIITCVNESENNLVFDNNSVNKSSLIFDKQHLEAENLQNEVESDNNLVKSYINN